MKFQLVFLLLIATFSANAQFGESKYVIGGAVRYSNNSYLNTGSFGLTPNFAKIIHSKSLIGLSLDYTSGVSIADSGNTQSTSNMLNAGVYYQRFIPIKDNVFFNWQAEAFIGVSISDQNSSSADNNRTYGFRLIPGLSWKAMDKLLFHASLGGIGYSHRQYNFNNAGGNFDIQSNEFDIYFNNPQFGLTYFLN